MVIEYGVDLGLGRGVYLASLKRKQTKCGLIVPDKVWQLLTLTWGYYIQTNYHVCSFNMSLS